MGQERPTNPIPVSRGSLVAIATDSDRSPRSTCGSLCRRQARSVAAARRGIPKASTPVSSLHRSLSVGVWFRTTRLPVCLTRDTHQGSSRRIPAVKTHSFRGGHPAATHATIPSDRHSCERPMRTGSGQRPAACHDHHVRSDRPHR